MKKLVISFGDDKTKQIESSYTVIPCILPEKDNGFILFRDGMLPEVFYCFSDLFSFFDDIFVL